jgi:tyrosyl-DNA phosphodiesterase-1
MPHIKSYTRYLPPNSSSSGNASSSKQTDGSSSSQQQQQDGPAGAGAELAWCVITSHNMSKAAWGSLQKGGSQLMIRRWGAPQYLLCCDAVLPPDAVACGSSLVGV